MYFLLSALVSHCNTSKHKIHDAEPHKDHSKYESSSCGGMEAEVSIWSVLWRTFNWAVAGGLVSTLGLGPLAIVTRCNVLPSNPSLSH